MQDRRATAALVQFSCTKQLVLSVLTYSLLPLANGNFFFWKHANGNSPRGWANIRQIKLRADAWFTLCTEISFVFAFLKKYEWFKDDLEGLPIHCVLREHIKMWTESQIEFPGACSMKPLTLFNLFVSCSNSCIVYSSKVPSVIRMGVWHWQYLQQENPQATLSKIWTGHLILRLEITEVWIDNRTVWKISK